MVRYCAVRGCRSKSLTSTNPTVSDTSYLQQLSFHHIPNDIRSFKIQLTLIAVLSTIGYRDCSQQRNKPAASPTESRDCKKLRATTNASETDIIGEKQLQISSLTLGFKF